MNNFGISSKSYHLIIHTLMEFPEIEEAKIFGSRAMGNYQKGSDIDIAIFGKEVTAQMAMKLCGILNEDIPIPYKVDVVSPSHVKNSALIEHIQQVGVLIYKKNNRSGL